jgi:hypothetical protein
MYKKLSGMVLWLISLGAIAQQQQENKGVFNSPVMPGPNGVFIYASDSTLRMRRPAEGQSYILYKEEKKGAGFRNIATMSFPSSAADLQKKLGTPLLQEILQKRNLRSGQDLYAQLKAGHWDTLGIFTSTVPVLEALGALYIDRKQTRPDPGISYRLDLSLNGNTRTLYQVALGSIRYSPLPRFRKYRAVVTDSNALVIWYAAGIQVPLKAETPKASYATIFTTAGTRTETTFNPAARQYVYKRRDTLFVAYSTLTNPGSKLLLYVCAEDIAGNRGPASDTAHLLALSLQNTYSIEHLTATDTLGCVWLKWDSLPRKAWYSGIQVSKSRSAMAEYIVVDTLPVTAVAYRDRKTLRGNVYYYQLRPILFDLPQKGRITPALVNVRTKNIGGKIASPQGLRLTLTPKSDIRLSWEPNPELEIFAYYVLRGTSAGNMQVISPAIRDTLFTDTLKGLNAGITYLYSVAAVNMDMQWGDTSAPVGIQSPRARLVTPPGGIQARAGARGVRLNWNDVKINDPSVTGYMVYRRKKGDAYFTPLSKTALPGTYFTDSSALTAGIYEYGCSSVDAWAHVSILSALAEVNLTGDALPLSPPSGFFLRNLSAGIEISLPAPAGVAAAGSKSPGDGRQRYILYRRTITEKQYRKIGELTANNVSYTDREVQKDQLYAYAITFKNENAESGKSGEKSIRRK